jgi:hypothetical protein
LYHLGGNGDLGGFDGLRRFGFRRYDELRDDVCFAARFGFFDCFFGIRNGRRRAFGRYLCRCRACCGVYGCFDFYRFGRYYGRRGFGGRGGVDTAPYYAAPSKR